MTNEALRTALAFERERNGAELRQSRHDIVKIVVTELVQRAVCDMAQLDDERARRHAEIAWRYADSVYPEEKA